MLTSEVHNTVKSDLTIEDCQIYFFLHDHRKSVEITFKQLFLKSNDPIFNTQILSLNVQSFVSLSVFHQNYGACVTIMLLYVCYKS